MPMLKNYIYILIIILFNLKYSFSQQFITPTWQTVHIDTTLRDAQAKSTLEKVLYLNEDEVIMTNYGFLGWTVQRVNIKTGKIIWQNSRNQNKPVVGKDTYIYLDTFIDADGNVEVIGVRSRVPFPLIFIQYGFLVRNVFDKNNGAELEYLYNPDKNAYVYNGVLNSYIKENNNKSFLMDSRINGKQTLMLGTVDSNLVFQDTLAFFNKGLDSTQQGLRLSVANAHKIGDKIFALSFLFGGIYDTTGFRHVFSSYDIKKKVTFERELSRDLLYYINNIRFTNISDGILHLGYTDSTLSILKKGSQKQPKYMGKVSKITIDGKVEWTTFIPHPLPLSDKYYSRIVAVEDTTRKGYWVMAGNQDIDTIPMALLFLNQKGKIEKTVYIKKQPIRDGQCPIRLYNAPNGGLFGNFYYFSCSTQYDTCFKTFYFEKAVLNAIVSTNVSPVLLEDEGLNLYPNPCSDYFNIDFSDLANTGSIQILNVNGKVINSFNTEGDKVVRVDTGNYANGVYFIYYLDKNNKIAIRKIIVQH
jgi:hypothetical protein